jgi:ribosomal protein L11 methyltransferase
MGLLSRTHYHTTVARLMTDAATAGKIGDAVTAQFGPQATAAASFEEPDGRWSIALHFRDPPDEAAIRELIAAIAGARAATTLTFETLAVVDWVRHGLAVLTPVDAGRFTVHGAHDRTRIGANRIAIEIEAALAFGTGHHGTTRGCLIALDRIVKRERLRRRPARAPPIPLQDPTRPSPHSTIIQARGRGLGTADVLDLGTGSGVLAIAAAKALRRPVLASDNDPRAVAVARANARLNLTSRYIEVICTAGLDDDRFQRRGPYRLILANILLEPLQKLATPLARLLAPDGEIVLSGLLAGQQTAALASYRARGLALAGRIELGGWMTLVLRRP